MPVTDSVQCNQYISSRDAPLKSLANLILADTTHILNLHTYSNSYQLPFTHTNMLKLRNLLLPKTARKSNPFRNGNPAQPIDVDTPAPELSVQLAPPAPQHTVEHQVDVGPEDFPAHPACGDLAVHYNYVYSEVAEMAVSCFGLH
jgi:hypothetical protein